MSVEGSTIGGRSAFHTTLESWPLAVSEYVIHCHMCAQDKTDKAVDTLETPRQQKRTECIALNVRASYGWTTT